MSKLLEEIAALGDEAFVAWELANPTEALALNVGHDSDFHVHRDWFDGDRTRKERPYLARGGSFLGVYVEELKRWFFKLPEDNGFYEPMEQRAKAALAAHAEAA